MSADSYDTQLTWLKALEMAGVEILPEADVADDFIKNAKSIFEFEVKDIDNNNVDLRKYTYVWCVRIHECIEPLLTSMMCIGGVSLSL